LVSIQLNDFVFLIVRYVLNPFSLFRCVLVSMGFAFSYMSYLKLEFKFQITIPKFEGEGGHVYTVVVIYILKFEIWIQVSNKTLLMIWMFFSLNIDQVPRWANSHRWLLLFDISHRKLVVTVGQEILRYSLSDCESYFQSSAVVYLTEINENNNGTKWKINFFVRRLFSNWITLFKISLNRLYDNCMKAFASERNCCPYLLDE